MTGDQTDIFNRLKGMLPSRWFGTATDSVPLVDAILTGLSTSLAFLYSLYQYAKLQTRINTATDGWLDLIAADFFGPTGLPRKTGQSDASYRNAIKVALLREKATRNAIINTLTSLTGRAPIIVEPQRPADTGAYGFNPAALLVGASIYRNDWQGNQQLYPTARTNTVKNSANLSGATATNCTLATSSGNGPDGAHAYAIITATSASAPQVTVQMLSAPSLDANGNMNFVLGVQDVNAGFVCLQLNQQLSSTVLAASAINFNLSSGGWGSEYAVGSNPVNGFTNLQAQKVGGWWYLACTVPPKPTATSFTPYVGPANSISSRGGTIGAAINVFGVTDCPGTMIFTGATAVTVTDYTVNATGVVAMAKPPLPSAALTAISPSDGFTTPQPLGTGDGYTSNFAMTIPTGPYAPSGYGVAGGYGSLLLPYQAFVTAFRPRSNVGIANVAGYGISTGGYSQASQAEYASMTMVSGGVTDSDIFAAIDAVKPAGTIVWTRISN